MKGKKAGSSGRTADQTMAERSGSRTNRREGRVPGSGQPRPAIARTNWCAGFWRSFRRRRVRRLGSFRGRWIGQSAESDFGHPVGHDATRDLARAAGQYGPLQRARGAIRGQSRRGHGLAGTRLQQRRRRHHQGFCAQRDHGSAGTGLAVAHAVQRCDPAISIRNLSQNSARRRMIRCWCCRCY